MATAKKNDSVRFRLSTEHKMMMEHAADCMGQDLSHYIINSVLEKAKKDIKEHQEIKSLVLSNRDYDSVTNEISNPSEPNDYLVNALKANKKYLLDE